MHLKQSVLEKKKAVCLGTSLGDPMVTTLCSKCRGPRFNPWSGNWIPHAATKDPARGNEDPGAAK